ncbi:MAG: hypothetical protein MJY96_03690 [Bacteroidaceae bacterium]|nr:hypothetical protein [Bacteroidaceae bacterium]
MVAVYAVNLVTGLGVGRIDSTVAVSSVNVIVAGGLGGLVLLLITLSVIHQVNYSVVLPQHGQHTLKVRPVGQFILVGVPPNGLIDFCHLTPGVVSNALAAVRYYIIRIVNVGKTVTAGAVGVIANTCLAKQVAAGGVGFFIGR